MKKSVIFFFVFLLSYTSLKSQNDHYWYNDKKFYLEDYNKKNYIVVDSTITNKDELIKALDDTSLSVIYFTQTNVLNIINVYDSTLTEKQYAIIQSQGNIDEKELEKNSVVNYVGPYYKSYNHGASEFGISRLFHVMINDQNDTVLLDSMANDHNVTILGNNVYLPLIYTLECTNQSTGNALKMANLFYESNLYSFAQPSTIESFEFYDNQKSTEICSNDALFNKQWGMNNNGDHDNIDINACNAWNITKGSSDIIISVLDSGIKSDHEDLFDAVDENLCWNLENQTNECEFHSANTHGTNCGGIIGAQHNDIGIAGVAPDCKLMSIFINLNESLNQYGENVEERLTNGISYAWQNGADVLSNSWASRDYTSGSMLDIAFSNAKNQGRNGKGCVIVVSAGNENSDTVSYPADKATHIAVGAVDSCGYRCVSDTSESTPMCGTPWWSSQITPPSGSNYGDCLDVVAPGSDIPTTSYINTVNDTYVTNFGGTSGAAPYVAGVAALLLSVDSTLTHSEVKDIIEQTAQKIRPDFMIMMIMKKTDIKVMNWAMVW
jgi:subtilisin family serine protease